MGNALTRALGGPAGLPANASPGDAIPTPSSAAPVDSMLTAAFDALPSKMLLIDSTRRIAFANRAVREKLGLDLEQIKSMRCPRAMHASATPCPDCPLDEVLATGAAVERVIQDQSGRWLAANMYPTGTKTAAGLPLFVHVIKDITARRQAEQELARSEARYRALHESASEAVMLLDQSGFFDCNDATLRLFGCRDKREFCGRHPADLSPPFQPCGTPSLELAGVRIATALERGSLQFEWVHWRHDTRRAFPADVTLSRMDLEGRQVLQATIRDVSERAQAEEALRQSEARFRALVENQGEGVLLVDIQECFAYASPAAERIFGVPRGTLVGRSLAEFVTPDEFARFRGRTAERARGQSESYESVIRRPDGTLVHLLVTATPQLDANGVLRGIYGIVVDITARKQAELELGRLTRLNAAILDAAGEGIVGLDAEGRHTFVNPAAAHLLGYPAAELIGAPSHELWHHSRPDGVPYGPGECPICAAYTGGVTHMHRDQVFWRKDHSALRVEYVSTPIVENGEVRGAVVTFRDVTAERQMEERLRRADRMVSVGTLAAGAAHEINNPLAYVIANLDYAVEELGAGGGAPADDVVEALREAQQGAARVRRIVRDLKLFARPEEDRDVPVSVEAVLESSIGMAFNEIKHRARLERDFGGVPAVHANEARLGQVFLNLLVNAAQAIPEGHAERNTITVRTLVDGAARVAVEVADTGAGMTPAVMGRIFDPFFTTKPVGQGMGLGLPICQGIVTALGGEIQVQSTVGAGTTFRVVLPVGKVSASPPAPASRPASVRRGRLLVVDDDELVARALARTLNERHEVVIETAAPRALARVVAGERFDVVLSDLMMPDMTGMELYAELERQAPAMLPRVVFLTGGAFTPQASEFLARVPNARLDKPVDARELASVLDALLAAT